MFSKDLDPYSGMLRTLVSSPVKVTGMLKRTCARITAGLLSVFLSFFLGFLVQSGYKHIETLRELSTAKYEDFYGMM